ncbi:MAG: polymer-forming cytoskeletal protein [Vicinamibacterales bacterium]
MWNRGDARAAGGQVQPALGSAPARGPHEAHETGVAKLGSSVCVKGELSGAEDLLIDGRVEGRIDLPDHTLTVGPSGHIRADIVAKVVTVFGTVVAAITARDRVEIRRGGSVEGPLVCPSIAIEDGAHFKGRVEMPTRQPKRSEAQTDQVTPALRAVGGRS